jgi:peptide/nickel transport system permease protein
VLSRLIWGSRISLVIGFASVLIGMIAGTAMGMIAGYYRGRVESVIMRGIDVVMSFPELTWPWPSRPPSAPRRPV